MRSRFANGTRSVGAVNPITLEVQAHPARTHRIVFPRRHHLAFVRPRGVGNVADDGEISFRARAVVGAYRDGINLDYFSVINQRQLAVRNADEDKAGKRFLVAGVGLLLAIFDRLRCFGWLWLFGLWQAVRSGMLLSHRLLSAVCSFHRCGSI